MGKTKIRSLIVLCFAAVMCIVALLCCYVFSPSHDAAYAEDRAAKNSADASISVRSYRLEDNSGYHESSEARAKPHPLNKNLIDLNVHVESEYDGAVIDKGVVDGYSGYGITGSGARIELSYNFPDPQALLCGKNGNKEYVYSISSDTATSVGEFVDIGVVGTGAMLFQKKTDPAGAWSWQNRDGETKKQLHTFGFTDTVRLQDYCGGDKYVLYTPSGADLRKGVYIKITFAYELKCTENWKERNWLGINVSKSETSYINMLETAEFYLVQNSGRVLFHNASTFGKLGDDDESGAMSSKFETLLSGDGTLGGFRLDTLGVTAYDITYRHNGGGSQRAVDGQYFLDWGRYDFTVKRRIGPYVPYTIFVDRREINDAAVGYFGQSLFTENSKRVYTTGEYPAYLSGADWNLNATDGTVLPVAGKLFRIDDGEEQLVKVIAQSYGSDYKTNRLRGRINDVGVYKAEFWSNPRYIKGGDISGDMYHFVFRFEIVGKDTPQEPSINETYLNGLIGFGDLKSKYYSVALETAGAGRAVFAFSDYGGAYDFAYETEREKVKSADGGYEYAGARYATQKAVLEAVDENAKAKVTVRYFDATDPESYQTADVADEKITDLSFTKDVIVFTNDAEQGYLQAGLPTLNGRRYRYISPDSDEPEEGMLYFAFINVAGFESDSVTLTNKTTGDVYDNILYGVSVEYQLGLENADSGIYTVKERNKNGAECEYDAVYIKRGDMTGSATFELFRNGELVEKKFDKRNTVTETHLSGFILKSVDNELDPYGIIKITHGGRTETYSYDDVKGMRFADGGVYDFVLADRQGNTIEFTLIIMSPVGFADVHLELEQADDTIEKDFHVFVGQEITLPVPTLENELYVFDGWLYDDVLITDCKLRPQSAGAHYVWQQITQKYTYLDFDSNGGSHVERIKVEIGAPIALPTATKAGWAFGGWAYGGSVYTGAFTPTTASPTFVAVWNYMETTIELYDGNLYDTLVVHVGDKVLLPFPARTGYTFFGWREEQSGGSAKVYYGQITKLENIEYLRLDALWIRESDVSLDDLASGTGGRTAIHFVDGALLAGDSLQGASGTEISLPKPTRAGYVFVGWIRRTTPVAGKIYIGNTMTIPDGAGEKIMLEALWIARPTSGTHGVSAGTTDNGNAAVSTGSGGLSKTIERGAPIACLTLAACALCILLARRAAQRKSNVLLNPAAPCRAKNERAQAAKKAAGKTVGKSAAINAPTYTVAPQRRARRSKLVYCIKYGMATVCTAVMLVFVLSLTGAFGEWANLGVFQSFAEDKEAAVSTYSQTETISDDIARDRVVGGSLRSDPVMPTKTEVVENFQATAGATDLYEFDLSKEEMFLYSTVMSDLCALDYDVFPAQLTLSNSNKIFGIGYSDFQDEYIINENIDEIKYYAAGFISLPRQETIDEEYIKQGLEIINLYDEAQNETAVKKQRFLLSFFENYGPCHYVAYEKYVVYALNNTNLFFSSISVNKAIYNSQYGKVYSYDDDRYVFDPDLGKKADVKATSINTLLDPVIAKNEYGRYIAEQTANGFTVDTMNFVYISYAAIEAYYLSNQDESLLGIDVQEFYEAERTVGPNEYYTVDAEGNLTKLEFPPKEEEKASWLDRLTGAILAIDMILAGVIIVMTVSVFSCGAATAAAPYIMGAFIGAGMEVFMQTVIQGKKLEDINWLRVGIAAVSGVLSAIPGIGWFGAGMLQGVTEAAMTAVDGGSLQDVLKAFTVGFVTGVVIHGVGKALSKIKFCFVAGTAVLMASGAARAIETIHAGDIVKSYNEATGKTENKRVLQTYENETDELVTVTTSDGQSITSTGGHKFYANNKWLSAEDLRAGDILVNVNGQKVVVEKIRHELLENPVKVYNFEVADNHTYFVGGNVNVAYSAFILTHNKACGNPGRAGKQARLKELAQDTKVPKHLRAEIIQSKKVYGRYRVPEGYQLRHRLGYEAYKGYSYKFADLQLISLHNVETKLQRLLGMFF